MHAKINATVWCGDIEADLGQGTLLPELWL
jgi:hypothetical protein